MIQIRQSVFETNSSSSHSIVVQNKSEQLYQITNREVHSDFASYDGSTLILSRENYFGWGWNVLTNWLDRFAYAIASFSGDDETIERIISHVKDRLGCEIEIGTHTPWWADSKTFTEPDYGSIDHQSSNVLIHTLGEEGIDPIDFIFDDRYIVIIDNDNNYPDTHDEFVSKLDIKKEYNTWED